MLATVGSGRQQRPQRQISVLEPDTHVPGYVILFKFLLNFVF